MIERLEEISREFDSIDFRTRLHIVGQMGANVCVWNNIKYRGYLKMKDEFAISNDKGEHYVYLWKHMRGDIFYVGSGKGKRCEQKYRGSEFLKHLDKGDAIVYIVLENTDKETAMFYERYLSGCLSDIGQPLVNKDNNVNVMGKEKLEKWLADNDDTLKNDLTKRFEKVLLDKVLIDKNFSYEDVLAKEKFLKENGDEYFSSEVWRDACLNQQTNVV